VLGVAEALSGAMSGLPPGCRGVLGVKRTASMSVLCNA
jgi:hypothetical protein